MTRTMKNTRLAGVLALSLAVVAPLLSHAVVPGRTTLQGQLLNEAGAPVTGVYTLKLTVYSAKTGGTALHTETQSGVVVTNGLFDIVLGSTSAIAPSVFSGGTSTWVGVKVQAGPGVPAGGEDELPRKQLTTVAYAFSAASANQSLDLACSGCVSQGELSFNVATQTELDAAVASLSALIPTSVNGLGGGTINGNVTVTGSLKVGANTVCTTAGNCGDTLTALTCSSGQVAKWNGSKWACANDTGGALPPKCDGQFEALQFDGSDWQCKAITQTGLSGGEAKGFEAKDSWGFVWDGIERQSASWATANVDCLARGGRLPTVTELYRVSGADKSEVGNSYETNYLWSRTPWSKTNYTRVRLTDGAITNTNATSNSSYRCVWSNNSSTAFNGNHCYGPAGSECWDTVAEDKMAMDKYTRPKVSYVAATDECNFYHAHVATELDFTENIRNGLPNGAGSPWLWTSDAASYRSNMVIRWTGVDTAYIPYGTTYQSYANRASGPYNFRCKGVNDQSVGANPNTVTNQYVASTTTNIKANQSSSSKVKYWTASDTCFATGGHVAHERDIMELVRHGMGNGPGTGGSDYMWLSDFSRYDIAQVTRWGGIDTKFTDHYSEYTTWTTLSNTSNDWQYRCVYYPFDADFTGPAASKCAGGFPCYQVTKGSGTKQLKVWADSIDRSKVNYVTAVQDCLNQGGRLANTRQMTELIRAGLPNGDSDFVWTSDAANEGNSQSMVVKWNGTETGFKPIYSANMTWVSKANSSTQQYRCVWTNELW